MTAETFLNSESNIHDDTSKCNSSNHSTFPHAGQVRNNEEA